MHPAYFGDSFDLVKRFFIAELKADNFSVAINPMLTGDWSDTDQDFYKLINCYPKQQIMNDSAKTALFIDPDTGVNERGGKQHISYKALITATKTFDLVFSFDQSFSRQAKPKDIMLLKLRAISELGGHGMYYDSHARFLFVARNAATLNSFRNHLEFVGIPNSRLINSDA